MKQDNCLKIKYKMNPNDIIMIYLYLIKEAKSFSFINEPFSVGVMGLTWTISRRLPGTLLTIMQQDNDIFIN